jgi:hypothetical protein
MAISYRRLGAADIPAILSLETASWPHGLRVDPATLEERLSNGHTMLGAFQHDGLIGIAAWRYGMFDPKSSHPYPLDFDTFANSPSAQQFNAAYVYNFALLPNIRKTRQGINIGLSLISAGIDILITDGCKYLVGASRCPSYAGCNDDSIKCKQSMKMKSAVDSLSADTKTELDIPWQDDPVLSFYKHALQCKFVAIMPRFMPEDTASGGYAIGFYKELNKPNVL